MAMVYGCIISYFEPMPIDVAMPLWLNVIITGAAVLGGSGFWNSILETAYQFKKSMETKSKG